MENQPGAAEHRIAVRRPCRCDFVNQKQLLCRLDLVRRPRKAAAECYSFGGTIKAVRLLCGIMTGDMLLNEGDAVNATAFYDHVTVVMVLPPAERHQQLEHLHGAVLRPYQTMLNRLTAEEIHHPLPTAPDQRTIAQIIAHIAAWDRFAVLAAGDILAGIHHPRMITDLSGYREPDGTFLSFATIDDFNAYHAQKFQTWSWQELQRFANDMTATLYSLFTHPQLLSATRLEQTTPFWKRLHNGTVIDNITMGWHLWLTMIEHLAVEHAALIDHYRTA
jgi:hypothetical protein